MSGDDYVTSRWVPERIQLDLAEVEHNQQLEPFETPKLGLRGASSLMSELSKMVHRLKDDLFVIEFKDPANQMHWSEIVDDEDDNNQTVNISGSSSSKVVVAVASS